MLSPSEKETLSEYMDQLRTATAERHKLTQRIKRMEAAARSILATTEDEEEIASYQGMLDEIIEPTGFTDAIRKVLQAAGGEALAPVEVRDRLPGAGFPLSGYSNPLASVHTILKRIASNDILYNVEAVTSDGKTAYRWVTSGDRMMRYLQSGSEPKIRLRHGKITGKK